MTTSFDRAGRPAPEEIRLDQATQILRVSFADATKAEYGAEYLRVMSPSAEVQGHGPGQRVTVPGKRHVRITAIEPVGGYAVRLRFDDGHDTGLYSWEYFYNGAGEQKDKWADYIAELAKQGLSRG
jgi:DUF971 family protein